MATQELLVETLKQLNPHDFDEFKSLIEAEEAPSLISRRELKTANTQDVVALMMRTYGGRCVEVTREALMKMSRTDLVQRLSSLDSGTEEELHVGELPLLIQTEVKKMESDVELLMETLADLRSPHLEDFKKKLRQILPYQQRSRLQMLQTTDQQDLVVLLVEAFGSQSVKKIMEILMEMKREDLVERLSDRSSTLKKKHLPEHLSPLIHKVATKVVVREQLLKTVEGVKYDQNFIWFLMWVCFKNGIPRTGFIEMSSETLVDQLMKRCGLRCLEVIREVFMDMNRFDVVKMLETSCGSEEQQSGVELWPALIHKVKTMESVVELLCETMSDLSDQDLQRFSHYVTEMIRSRLYSSRLYSSRLYSSTMMMMMMMMMEPDLQDLVFSVMVTFGQQSVEEIKNILKEMKRSDLVQRLSESSLEPEKELSVDDQRSALIHKVAVMAAVKQLLLEILEDLKDEELEEFKKFLQSEILVFKKKPFSGVLSPGGRRTEIMERMVDVMVDETGLQSVEVTRKFLLHINRTDLVQKLPETISGPKEEAAQLERVSSLKKILLETLDNLSRDEFYKFTRLLQFTCFQKSLPQLHLEHLQFELLQRQSYINRLKDVSSYMMAESQSGLSYIDPSGSITTIKYELMDEMVEVFGLQCLEVTREVFMDMNRTDLVKTLSESSSASEETSRSLKSEGCGVVEQQESSSWTQLEPEVNRTHTGEATTYKLRSGPGHFECSVSGLRWFCQQKSILKYQFCSWGPHMDRMEDRQFIPAGPLMDVTVIAGKLSEVYLPHWICTEDNSKILDMFAVLHIKDCGDFVEKVSEVTASHVRLTDPTFSAKGVLMKAGLPVKYKCKMLIYKTNKAFLTLDVYLIPDDPALVEDMKQKETSYGYTAIRKPDPESLKMGARFILTTDFDGSEINPEKGRKLKYPRGEPDFFEMYVKKPDRDFKLILNPEKVSGTVWDCTIRKDDYQKGPAAAASSSGATGITAMADVAAALEEAAGGDVMVVRRPYEVEHFVEKHMEALIQRVSSVDPILDALLKKKFLQAEEYDTIRALPTSQKKMRELYRGPLNASRACKEELLSILQEQQPHLIKDLQEN